MKYAYNFFNLILNNDNDNIIAFGSFFIVSDILKSDDTLAAGKVIVLALKKLWDTKR